MTNRLRSVQWGPFLGENVLLSTKEGLKGLPSIGFLRKGLNGEPWNTNLDKYLTLKASNKKWLLCSRSHSLTWLFCLRRKAVKCYKDSNSAIWQRICWSTFACGGNGKVDFEKKDSQAFSLHAIVTLPIWVKLHHHIALCSWQMNPLQTKESATEPYFT